MAFAATLLDYAHTIADEEELREYLHSIVGKAHCDSFCRSYLRRRGVRPVTVSAAVSHQPNKSLNSAASARAPAAQPPANAAAIASAKAEQNLKKAKTNSKAEQPDPEDLADSTKKSQSKGNKKGQVVDPTSLLGFRVASSSARFNVGDIDRPS